jgi:hypothetical protein
MVVRAEELERGRTEDRSRQQAEVIQNHEDANVRKIAQGEPRHRKYKRLKPGGGQAYDRSGD